MHLLWMVVVVLLLFVQRKISIIIDYIENSENGFYHQGIEESKQKSIRQDMFASKESDRFEVSYPLVEYCFHQSMLNKNLCEQYTLECIYYRSNYPRSRLSFDGKTGERYNPCHRFVEPCFGISENDYRSVKKFKSLRSY